MWFVDKIFSLVWDISEWFLWVSQDARGIPVVGPSLSDFFYFIHRCFYNLLSPIADFSLWSYDIWERVQTILTEPDIWTILATPIKWAQDAWTWVSNAWFNIINIVNAWWGSASQTVLVWVNEAKDFAQSLVNDVKTWLGTLQTSWDSFKGRIPTIDMVISWFSNWLGNVQSVIADWWNSTLRQVQELINTAFVLREDWWTGWQDWRDQVINFFTDPVEFVWQKFTDWFLGPEV